ncbi:hypothetical protein BY996DRAFT_7503161 [Phakopsora pachyrhizi]|nr:hypothetical protein BY996DRAFT_7503161 [Phakopsora pachyrhizi]
MLYIKEDFVLEAVNDLSSKYQDSIINNWIKFSSSRRIVPSDPTSARTKFNFRIVFPKFLTYENFAGVFFTEDMRSRIIGEFKDLERRFVMKKEEHKIYKKHVKRFMDSIWAALTGFLAYVHAINAIIVSDSVLPLENYKIVEKQEEAFNFFFDLHKDAENFVRCDSERKTHKLKVEEGWKDLSFEVKRNHVLDIIFNSEARLERKAWLCIELWMIKYRPELYNIATNNSTNGILGKYNKFRSFINRVLFPLFSGILKYQKLQCQNKFGEKIHHAC